MLGVNQEKVRALIQEERDLFEATHPGSKKLYTQGLECFLYGAPMHWMQQWPGSYPIYAATARGARLTDIDGNRYVDFALGDTGAMFGHANPIVAEAIATQVRCGATMMLPTEDSIWVGKELARRFGLPFWQVTTSATDANRFAIRLCRMVTGKDKIITFNWNYHGSVDETQVQLDSRHHMIPRTGVHPNAIRHEQTTRLVEFNNEQALEQALACGDVACVLTEPILTNIGMVPAHPEFHEALRQLTRQYDAALVIDETHTISTGPGGYSGVYGLDPDFFVLGKCLAGGIPAAVWGVCEQWAGRIIAVLPHFKSGQNINHYGFGGTLAGSALQMKAIRATLAEVMTEDNYAHMDRMARRLEKGVSRIIEHYRLPWHILRIGARAEYLFSPRPPLNGGEAHAVRHAMLEAYIHLFMLNRGVLLTPFHNMVLTCPYTTKEDVDLHNDLLERCVFTIR